MIVLMLGSGPNVMASRDWPRAAFDRIVTINNAWAVRPDWDYLVFPDDFPPERRPLDLRPEQTLIPSDVYVPENNRYGGVVYAGATMAFSASYWALGALRPRVIGYLGCDMVYGTGATHFYGMGTADPLRPDPTLQNLRAKAARLELLAARDGCALVNLSKDASVLSFPRAGLDLLPSVAPRTGIADHIAPALAAERKLGAICPSGRYWDGPPLDAAALAEIDALWLAAHDAVHGTAVTPPAARPLPPIGSDGLSGHNGAARPPHPA
ncbi:hypothetical protein ROE7235_00253 [Roseibaca ekhonensis]|uniref:Uncharacterized protein n=1 Tax=Roseinatronobacter ekhonensis TaxID=254356 RepID=A0A3B0M4T3_9RHOB|nr:hypothetical protein [Roseibaca ekhonensis]SUZ30530.1 hypothetical protein ROE7235_00253 [Roseibaca ekhonensis]